METFETANITVDEFGVITSKLESGVATFVPGGDLSEASQEVSALAEELWTKAAIARYEQHIGIMNKVPAALKADALRQIADFAENYRAKLASTSAGKLAEYRIKEEIARDPANASEVELALISREAKARGTNRTGLLGQISAQAVAFRQVALLIGVLEAETGAAISAVPDDSGDVEGQILGVLAASRAQAQAAFAEAQALLAG